MAKGDPAAQPTQTTSYTMSPEERNLLDLAMPGVRNFASKPLERYQGNTVAGFDPSQVAGQEMALGAAGGQADLANAGVGTSNYWLRPDALNVNNDPYVQNAIQAATNPIWNNLQRQVLPGLRSDATNTGNFGSSRAGIAEGLATGEAARAAGDTGAKMALEELQNREKTQLQALGLLPQTQQSLLSPATTTSGVGDIRQQQAQRGIDTNVANFNWDQYAPFLQSQEIMSLMQGLRGTGTTTATGSTPPPANTAMQALGGGAAGASLGATLGSAIPGIGTLAGAGVGAAGGALLPFLFR